MDASPDEQQESWGPDLDESVALNSSADSDPIRDEYDDEGDFERDPSDTANDHDEDSSHNATDSQALHGVHNGAASISTSVLTLTNNIVGAGLFSLPWVLQQATITTGLALGLLVGVLSSMSFILLAKCCERSGSFRFIEMGRRALGPTFAVVVQVCCVCYACGSCVSYVVLAADFLVGDNSGVLAYWSPDSVVYGRPYSRALTMGGVGLFVLFPLSLLRNLRVLKYSSTVAVSFMLYGVGLLLAAARRGHAANLADGVLLPLEDAVAPTVRWGPAGTTAAGVFSAVPILNVAYCAHYNAPRFYEELSRRSIPRLTRVVVLANVCASLVYAVAALSGYLAFGSATLGDIILNFSPAYAPARVARLGLAILVACTFPLAHHSLRAGLIALAFPRFNSNTLPTRYHVAITAAVVAVVVVVGIKVKRVEDVLAYKGALFGSCIVFLFPATMYAAMCLRSDVLLRVRRGMAGKRPSNAGIAPSAYGAVDALLDDLKDEIVGSSSAPTQVDAGEDSSEGAVIVAVDVVESLGGFRKRIGRVARELFCGCWSGGRVRCSFANLLGFMFLWGAVTGVLGVVVAAMKQAGAVPR